MSQWDNLKGKRTESLILFSPSVLSSTSNTLSGASASVSIVLPSGTAGGTYTQQSKGCDHNFTYNMHYCSRTSMLRNPALKITLKVKSLWKWFIWTWASRQWWRWGLHSITKHGSICIAGHQPHQSNGLRVDSPCPGNHHYVLQHETSFFSLIFLLEEISLHSVNP